MKIDKIKGNGAITLIALIITIVILLILAGITINMIFSDNGMIKKIKIAKEETNYSAAYEEINLKILEVQVEKEGCATLQDIVEKLQNDPQYEYIVNYNSQYSSLSELGDIIDYKSLKEDIEEIYVMHKGYEFKIGSDFSITSKENNEVKIGDNDSLIGKISNITESGVQEIKVQETTYSTDVIFYNGNLELDGITHVEGATLENNVYEFGNSVQDCATSTTDYAKNMVILKVNGNLTINEGVTLTACKNEAGYGGPKGMLIYCTGTLINNGTISMTARGAYAQGQKVYLWENEVWENEDDKYEYIPSEGADGANGVTFSNTKIVSGAYTDTGKKGMDGTDRRTGGGGSGAIKKVTSDYTGTGVSGSGSRGTSYSGGSGGGGIDFNYSGTQTAGNGAENGGLGGNAYSARGNLSWMARGAGGGAGNPGGMGKYTSSLIGTDNTTYSGNSGTGGLAIIYANNFMNNGIIESNGSNGGVGTSQYSKGGASGGGSVNIFTNKCLKIGTVMANGGDFGTSGGNGTVTIGNISTGSFVVEE